MNRKLALSVMALLVAATMVPVAAAQSSTSITATINGQNVNNGDTVTLGENPQNITVTVDAPVNITSVTSEAGPHTTTRTPQNLMDRTQVEFSYNQSITQEMANFTVTASLENGEEKTLSANLEQEEVGTSGGSSDIAAQLDKLQEQVSNLQQRNQELKQKQSQLSQANKRLRDQNEKLKNQVNNESSSSSNNGSSGGNGQPGFTAVVAFAALVLAAVGYRYR